MGRPLGLVGFGHVTTFVTGQANVSPRIARADAASSRTHAESATCASSSCRRSGPSPTATSNAPRARGDTSSTASKTSRPASNPSSSVSTPSPIASITQGLTKPLAISPQPSTSQPSARRSPRLTWAELGHSLDFELDNLSMPRCCRGVHGREAERSGWRFLARSRMVYARCGRDRRDGLRHPAHWQLGSPRDPDRLDQLGPYLSPLWIGTAHVDRREPVQASYDKAARRPAGKHFPSPL